MKQFLRLGSMSRSFVVTGCMVLAVAANPLYAATGNVTCKDNKGQVVSDSFCDADSKPEAPSCGATCVLGPVKTVFEDIVGPYKDTACDAQWSLKNKNYSGTCDGTQASFNGTGNCLVNIKIMAPKGCEIKYRDCVSAFQPCEVRIAAAGKYASAAAFDNAVKQRFRDRGLKEEDYVLSADTTSCEPAGGNGVFCGGQLIYKSRDQNTCAR